MVPEQVIEGSQDQNSSVSVTRNFRRFTPYAERIITEFESGLKSKLNSVLPGLKFPTNQPEVAGVHGAAPPRAAAPHKTAAAAAPHGLHAPAPHVRSTARDAAPHDRHAPRAPAPPHAVHHGGEGHVGRLEMLEPVLPQVNVVLLEMLVQAKKIKQNFI